jgi:hypothetical protein
MPVKKRYFNPLDIAWYSSDKNALDRMMGTQSDYSEVARFEKGFPPPVLTRVVQLQHGPTRRVALVEEPDLLLLAESTSVYRLAEIALRERVPLADVFARLAKTERIDYDAVYAGRSEWRLMVPIDHPAGPARCLVSGTGLTHLGSAESRDAMHGKSDAELTDSMRMFKSGVEGGRPAPGAIGTPPEWFYKGSGDVLRAHLDPLAVPPYALDGGEEAEIAGVYVIDESGQPRRIGMATGNEFSDHKFERINYLNLAGSKLRACSLGPELVIDPDFQHVRGRVAVERSGSVLWSRDIATGLDEMCHSLANIEHHHFKFDAHRRPGDLHVHFFGAPSLSFADGVQLADGDVMAIQFDGFGRALRNPVRVASAGAKPVMVKPL